MIACLRPFLVLCLAGLLAACASSPSSTLGELPRTPQATLEQLLQQADTSEPGKAAELRLSAADLAARQSDNRRASQILEQVALEQLKPAQQIYASTLAAELAIAQDEPKRALQALAHPSLERLAELPVAQQIRTQSARANALEADGQLLAAARERVFIAPLLSGEDAQRNHESIWRLVSALPTEPTPTSQDADLAGWLNLASTTRTRGTLQQQQAAIAAWQSQNPDHPAARQLPQALNELMSLTQQPLEQIALLLPQDGPLASVARALRDGLLAAHYQAQQAGENPPNIQLYDSSRLSSLDDFYRQAQAAGVQLVIGPLEKPLVKQLSDREELPITTLALNYSDAGQEGPPQLFQFGLAAEDEAREVARRAWADGMRRAVALVPRGEWGERVLDAFRQQWQAQGGELLGAERVDQPVELANQIANLFQLRQSEARNRSLQSTGDTAAATQPMRRQDVDFIFLAATPQQAQQIKPTLAFQYAGDVPVYATSHLFTGAHSQAQYRDLNGIQFCETPWLLDVDDPLRRQVDSQWPQAGGSLGRLYAMGVDAFRLAPRLGQLKALPDTRIEGLSGRLSLNMSQRIERQLPWAEFRDGQIQRLPDTVN
ncbi:MAG: penicillin-binding protein activator [Gammaproteobacteria bacterium]|nr:penicillin-binding protein activator [Gammaproteobacteria bacterium]MBU1489156.1 penicillin-binding protein activator [Gammaproteobacteria bacterium]MBU2066501.1 penicillin-binding protein activator [Gammaproteobacteria bacterium]MBU2139417.1 penicillin-binding protein activator [Gammaproteobacteria bacterium]MBU2217973.1 penicillin-binding protein activator [Gammaproteobacteria bacterium]